MAQDVVEVVRSGPPPGRHRVVQALLLLHIPVFAVLGIRAGWSPLHVLLEVGVPLAAFWAVAHQRRGDRLGMGAGAVGLMYASAVLVHVTGGVTEAHFYFFVAFGLVALYRDWIVFFVAAAFAVGHHVLFALMGGQLFAQPYQAEDPLLWAAVHITFVAIVTGVQAVGMYDVARHVRATAELETRLERSADRRRTALTLHDDVVQALATAAYAREAGEEAMSGKAIGQALTASRALVRELLSDSPLDDRVLTRPTPALQEG